MKHSNKLWCRFTFFRCTKLFFKRFIAQKISEIHRVRKLQNCSFNQLVLFVPSRAIDREFTVLGSCRCSSEKQVERKNTAAMYEPW